MRRKNKWTYGRLYILTLTLIFSMPFHGISQAEGSTAEFDHSYKHISKNRISMLKDLAVFLKLEVHTLHERLQKESLAEIAAQQGIERAVLKDKVVELLQSRAASKPSPLGVPMDFSAAADKLIDQKGGWHHGGNHRRGRLMKIEELAKLLKVTPEKLKESLHSGKSLASIAEENGVSVQTVIDQQVQAVTEQLDRQLAEGKLSKGQYEERKAKIRGFVTDFVYGRNFKQNESHFKHHSTSIKQTKQPN
ncbi:hypothetical protein [Paenibacillus dakarensis]|uniref:hypothetical protein n=1 Tax=Paenibacillus dakarensis TaxID=1527293 RepID=UPI0006D530D8|nr:hypothetical protein [Paenibacillus dakarensis]